MSPEEVLDSGDGNRARTLAAHLRQDFRLQEAAGSQDGFEQFLSGKRRQQVVHRADEAVPIERGADLERLLPSKFARLPRLLHRLSFL